MIIDKDIRKYIVFSEDSLLHGLEKISNNKMRVVFAVNEVGLLEGVMTDGDFRRWLTRQQDFNLNRSVIEVANRSFLSFPQETPVQTIEAHFSERIEHIPLVDDYFRLVGVATRRTPEISIEGRVIDQESPCYIIAEIGNNHNGDFELAKQLVDAAVEAGADCAKFQLRDLNSLYRNTGAQNSAEDLGTEYTLDLLDKFQLPDEQLFALFDYCREQGIIPMCTPYDPASLDKLEGYGLSAYKVASADLTNDDLLQAMASTGKPLICSTGMSREREIIHAVDLLRSYGAKYVLLHCNATYPAPFKDVQLNFLQHLQEIGHSFVGYSGHERGNSVPVAAVALGAKVVEKHLTLDKSMEGRDHQVSLLPGEFKTMVQSIREVELSLGGPEDGRVITQGELINRESLAKSLVARQELKQGTLISSEMIDIKSPGMGLPPYRKTELIGKKAKRDIALGDFFYPSDVDDETAKPRQYRFNRPWGIPVRFHDLTRMIHLSNMDFVEFHLSYKDLEVKLEDIFQGQLNVGFTVHSPELFAGDHILDLCSLDQNYWKQSLQEMQRVIDLAKRLQDLLPSPSFLLIVRQADIIRIISEIGHGSPYPKTSIFSLLISKIDRIRSCSSEVLVSTVC